MYWLEQTDKGRDSYSRIRHPVMKGFQVNEDLQFDSKCSSKLLQNFQWGDLADCCVFRSTFYYFLGRKGSHTKELVKIFCDA